MLTLSVAQARMLVPTALTLTAFEDTENGSTVMDRLSIRGRSNRTHQFLHSSSSHQQSLQLQSLHFSSLQLLDAHSRYPPTTLFTSFDFHHQLPTQQPST